MKTVPSIPAQQLEESKKDFLDLLGKVKRDGMDALTAWLCDETDFFIAPASTNKHGSFEGGLLLHSLNVYKLLKNFSKTIPNLGEESLIVAGLLHDVCKVNFYIKRIRNVKIPGEKRWEEEESFAIEDTFPMGHGEKSLYLVAKHMRLTDDEAMAIRWHMSGYDDAARGYVGGMAQAAAFDRYPLAPALAIADMYATYFAT